MNKPIRIGGLVLNLSNLCYAEEGNLGELLLFMNCGMLLLRNPEAALVRSVLHNNSIVVGRTHPSLPTMGKGQTQGLKQPTHNGRG